MELHWLAASEDQVPDGTFWLGPWERARLAQMRYPKRRIEYLTSRHAAKLTIARVLERHHDAPARIEIRHRPGGAPMALVDGVEPELSISMTDRAGWAACLTTSAPVAVGVDLEVVEPRTPAFVRDYFTPSEQAFVAAAPDDEQTQVRANLVWSAKESALKVLRVGLRRDTRTVEVQCDTAGATGPGPVAGRVHQWTPLTVRGDEGRVFPGWWRRFGAFLLTVAAEEPLPAPNDLVDPAGLATATPLHSWMGLPLVVPEGAPPG